MGKGGNLMTKKYVLTTFNWKDEQLKEMQESLPTHEFIMDTTDTEKLEKVEIVLHWTPEMTKLWKAKQLPNLKWVQVISAGINSAPLDEFETAGIILTNASGIHQHTISEFVIAALLFDMRQFKELQHNQKNNVWGKGINIQELRRKTMMIMGIGNIGQRLATIAKAFGMTVIGVNRSGRKIAEVDQTVTQDNADEFIGNIDVLVSILPETEETKNYFDQKRFEKMKKGVKFINVGRGSSVDTEALIDALDKGIVSFAGLDVFEEEPLQEDSPLWQHEKVFVSPHMSGALEHFRSDLFEVVGPNIKAYATSGTPEINVIDYKKGY